MKVTTVIKGILEQVSVIHNGEVISVVVPFGEAFRVGAEIKGWIEASDFRNE